MTPKYSASIKRSKSLKVVSSCDKSHFSFCASSPIENKRRSSLESNFDEHTLDSEYNLYGLNKLENDSCQDQRKKNVLQKSNKYDLINIQEQRPFLRSVTSLDLRQKLYSNNNSSGNNLVKFPDEMVSKQKCKLLRSNTQINVVKRNDTMLSKTKKKFLEADMVDSNSPLNTEDHNHYSHLLNFTVSLENLKEQHLQFSSRPIGNCPFSIKQNVTKPNSADKELFHQKINELPKRQVHSFHNAKKSGNSRVLREPTKPQNRTTRSDYSNTLTHDSYTAEKNMKATKPGKSFVYGMKSLASSSHSENSDSSPVTYQNSSYLRTNHMKQINVQKKLQLNKSVELPLKNELSLPVHGFPKESYSCINPHREDARSRQISGNHEEFLHANNFLVDDTSFGGHHPSTSCFINRFHSDEINDIEHGPWVERDRMQAKFNKHRFSKDYFGGPSPHSLLHKAENNESLRTLNNELDVCRTKISSMMGEPIDEIDSSHDLNSFDSSFNKDPNSLLVSPNEIKYAMQNRKNMHQYNVSTHSGRNTGSIVSSSCTDASGCMPSQIPCKNTVIAQRCIEGPVFNQDSSFYTQGMHWIFHFIK